MRIEVSEFEIESPRVNFRSKMRSEMVSKCGPKWFPNEVRNGPPRGTEKDHLCQVVNNGRAVGDSSRKWRVASIRIHSPISLTLPLSSPKGDGFATTPARGRRLPVRASVIIVYLRRSATEAQLGLESEVELRCTEVPRSSVRA